MGRGSREAINIATMTLMFELVHALERTGGLTAAQVDGMFAAARDSQAGAARAEAQAFLDHLHASLALARGKAA